MGRELFPCQGCPTAGELTERGKSQPAPVGTAVLPQETPLPWRQEQLGGVVNASQEQGKADVPSLCANLPKCLVLPFPFSSSLLQGEFWESSVNIAKQTLHIAGQGGTA